MPHRGGKEHSLLSRHKDLGLSASNERKHDTSCEHQETEARGFQVPGQHRLYREIMSQQTGLVKKLDRNGD